MTFDPELGQYVPSEGRCTARWAGRGDDFAEGQICGRPVSHSVADFWMCEKHYKRLRSWIHDVDGRASEVLKKQEHEQHRLAASLSRERHREQMELDREQAKQQRELDRERIRAEERARAAASVVYYVQRSDGLIKIGTSRQLAARLITLKREHGELTLMAVHGGAHKEENAAHTQFRELRVEGEWFRAEVPLVEHIAKMRQEASTFRRPGLPECVDAHMVNSLLWHLKRAAKKAQEAA
jgi:hypothetical protein